MRISRLLLTAALWGLASALAAPALLAAEEATVVAPGSRVRVSVGPEAKSQGAPVVSDKETTTAPVEGEAVTSARTGATVVGTVQALDDKALVLRMKGDGHAVTIPLSTVSRIEVGTSSRGKGAGRGALFGLLGGAVIGAAAGSDCKESDFMCFNRTATGLGGAVLGVSIGALIGLAFPGEAWHEGHLKGVQVRAATLRGRGAGLSLSAGF